MISEAVSTFNSFAYSIILNEKHNNYYILLSFPVHRCVKYFQFSPTSGALSLTPAHMTNVHSIFGVFVLLYKKLVVKPRHFHSRVSIDSIFSLASIRQLITSGV